MAIYEARVIDNSTFASDGYIKVRIKENVYNIKSLNDEVVDEMGDLSESDYIEERLGENWIYKEKKDGDNCYWKHCADICAYYIPLIDNRGIIPPTKKTGWGKNDILNVLYGKQISHISRESFEFISSV